MWYEFGLKTEDEDDDEEDKLLGFPWVRRRIKVEPRFWLLTFLGNSEDNLSLGFLFSEIYGRELKISSPAKFFQNSPTRGSF